AGCAKATHMAAEVVGEESDQQVPLDEGTLKASKEIRTDKDGDTYIGYGFKKGTGTIIPYAVRWHEHSARFQHGRKSQYLRDPVKTVGPGALKRSLESVLGKIF